MTLKLREHSGSHQGGVRKGHDLKVLQWLFDARRLLHLTFILALLSLFISGFDRHVEALHGGSHSHCLRGSLRPSGFLYEMLVGLLVLYSATGLTAFRTGLAVNTIQFDPHLTACEVTRGEVAGSKTPLQRSG